MDEVVCVDGVGEPEPVLGQGVRHRQVPASIKARELGAARVAHAGPGGSTRRGQVLHQRPPTRAGQPGRPDPLLHWATNRNEALLRAPQPHYGPGEGMTSRAGT